MDSESKNSIEPIEEKKEAASPQADTEAGGNVEEIRDKVIGALRTVFDPEIPVNIYELGLVYDIAVEPSGAVTVRLTLTSPFCPVAGSLPGEVEQKIRSLPEVSSSKVDLVWDPPWNPSMMTEAAKLQLGMF